MQSGDVSILKPPGSIGILRGLGRWFYFLMALLVGTAVAYGFSQTIVDNLLHPSIPRPRILGAHAAVFFGWVVLFITQTALIRGRRVRWHRRLGVAGLVLGSIMPFLGVATSLSMARFNLANHLDTPVVAAAFLAIPLNDMLAFATTFIAAAWMRKRPDTHRHLMFIATCCLTAAAFARFPFITVDQIRWYGGVDILLFLGVLYDWFTTRRIHAVYSVSLPLIVLGQVIAMTLFLGRPFFWIHIAQQLIG